MPEPQNVVGINSAGSITTREAEEIANAVDHHAGGFFRKSLIQAAKMGAELAAKKLRTGEPGKIPPQPEPSTPFRKS